MSRDKKMPFMSHIDELRGRLKISMIIFVIAFFVSYAFSAQILRFIWGHFLGDFDLGTYEVVLFASNVMGGFVTQLNLALILAATASIPVFIYELFLFMEPALDKKHKMIAIKIVLSASTLFVLGAAFVYFIMLPILMEFFILANLEQGVSNFLSVESFFEFIMMNMFIGGIIFQTPLIIVIANRIGILPKDYLVRSRRMAYIVVLVFAGIITPDHSIVSQLILSIVMMILFEVALLFSK
jgi:sec-independent protein translocase protein TatC